MSGLIDTLSRELFGGGDAAADASEPSAIDTCRDLIANPETTTLPDGRQLGYAAVGDPDGAPLVVFHGFPNCRSFAALLDEPARERGVRVYVPERPGFGVSDPDPGRTLADWPDDVAAFADAMGLGEFPVLGISGGGPYALACAALLEDRVSRAGVGCGVGPMDAIPLGERTPYYLARYLPPVVRLTLWRRGRTARDDPEAAQRRRADEAADVDEERWLGEPGRVLVETSVAAAAEHGTAPLTRELALFGSPWEFDLGDIAVPVHLWYGKRDRIVPVEMGFHLAREIPTAEAHFYPDLAHISVVQENRGAILDALVEQA